MGLLSNSTVHTSSTGTQRPQNVEEFLSEYVQSMGSSNRHEFDSQEATLIASTPKTAAAKALFEHMDELFRMDIAIRVIFACVEPDQIFQNFLHRLSDGQEGACVTQLARWARLPSLLEANEQLILGNRMCWLGDTMRRAMVDRHGLEIFEYESQSVQFGRSAFNAMWRAS